VAAPASCLNRRAAIALPADFAVARAIAGVRAGGAAFEVAAFVRVEEPSALLLCFSGDFLVDFSAVARLRCLVLVDLEPLMGLAVFFVDFPERCSEGAFPPDGMVQAREREGCWKVVEEGRGEWCDSTEPNNTNHSKSSQIKSNWGGSQRCVEPKMVAEKTGVVEVSDQSRA